jgi:hypothetical protein
MKNGIYESDNAVYFVYNGKILMQLKGINDMYKTTANFMQGNYIEPLTYGMIDSFEKVYNKVKFW